MTKPNRGYIPMRTKEIEGWWAVPEGSEPFRATIVTSLTFAEIDAISLDGDATFAELFPAIAPFVVAWNAMGRNTATGEYTPLPPPAEEGWEILLSCEPKVSTFLAVSLKQASYGDPEEREQKKMSSEPTPDGSPDQTPVSPTRVKPRRSRKTSTSSPGLTSAP